MKRRQFLFWFSFGLFSLGEVLGVQCFDRVAAAAMRGRGRGRSSSMRTSPSRATSSSSSNDSTTNSTIEMIADETPDLHEPDDTKPGEVSPTRRGRHGRPPSQWLRNLEADELRVWLKTIDVPEAGVAGMTFWTHLTRDHYFDAAKIEGLNNDEQALLHAAAHHGY